ncbi:MAG TPA: hypothetical protein DEO84_10985 [candidate division Zixibacteria bacterium]|nr:hypothetical protein [candidate division Zixibacteria bacterium]
MTKQKQSIPENSWQLYLDTVNKAAENISKIVGGKPMGPLLSQFLYTLAFQQGVCIARWVNNNKDLVRRLNAIQAFTKDEFDEIAGEVKASVEKMVKI